VPGKDSSLANNSFIDLARKRSLQMKIYKVLLVFSFVLALFVPWACNGGNTVVRGTPLFSEVSGFIKGATTVVLLRYTPQHGFKKTSEINSTGGLQAVGDWLKRNLATAMPYDEMGSVRPECELVICKSGDLQAASTQKVELYGETDSSGRRLIPDLEFELLYEIFASWGKPVE
jgi:hypothetical protein